MSVYLSVILSVLGLLSGCVTSSDGTAASNLTPTARFVQDVRSQISDEYKLPSDFRNKKIATMMGIIIDVNGKLSSVRIVESSGHPLFDEAVFKTLQKVDKLPVPPAELIGKEILLRFSP